MTGEVVIEWTLTTDDVARIRFALSPLWEAVLSLIVLRAPARHSLHRPWIHTTTSAIRDVDLSELFALIPVRGIAADFLSPPPASPAPELATELDRVRRTPGHRVIADLIDVPGIPDAVMERIRKDPEAAAARIADTLQQYWDLAIAPHWPRLRALLESDILWRSRRLATGGAQALFEDLHPSITWTTDRLTAADPWNFSGSTCGDGLLLVPSAMGWPTVRKLVAPYQPVIAYPARGVATLWETSDPPSQQTLRTLLGRTRADLLVMLAEPHSTTTLARLLHLTPGAVSQHLIVLRSNGLIVGSRVGGSVLYRRTPRGDAITEQ
jgi:DNA-binding transcriptional ArsR family regulator